MWEKIKKIDKGHAQLPLLKFLKDSTYRIFVSDRSPENKSFIRKFDFDIKTKKSFNHSFFASGVDGGFDSDGVMTSCFVDNNFYYTAWKKNKDKYKLSICLFKTDFETIFDRKISIEDDHLCCSPFIIKKDFWRMWFISSKDCGDWTSFGPRYTLRYASSNDGENWIQKEINFDRSKDEVFSRPFVKFNQGIWQMWYSYMILEKNKSYKIGYAESTDGINWKRLDNLVGIQPSNEGWDSRSIAFPYVISYDGCDFMFYSGNNFGKEGIGYAFREL